MYKIILAPIVLMMIGAVGNTYVMAQLDPNQGYGDGIQQAKNDAQAGVNMDASCAAHGISNVGNEQYCINFKVGYLQEQGALFLSK